MRPSYVAKSATIANGVQNMLKRLTCLIIVLLLASVAAAGVIEREFSFEPVQVTNDGVYDHFILEGLESYGEPGEPVLPMLAYTLLVPAGEELVAVRMIDGEWETLTQTTYPVPGSAVMPLSKWRQTELTPNPEIYQGASRFPAEPIHDIQTGFLRGHSLGSFLLNPIRWQPNTGITEQLRHVRLELITEPSYRAQEALRLLRGDDYSVKLLSVITDDLDQLGAYPIQQDRELDEVPLNFLIICDESHAEAWEEYAEFKRSIGMQTAVITTQDIYDEFEGNDHQDQIRNAIIDYYYSHWVNYILLGGDVAFVPYRGFYAVVQGQEEDSNIPADLYYAGLDGTWNTDNDNRWGESNEADLYQEVCIGRAPITSIPMIQTWIDKQIRLQAQPVVNEVTNALMVGEDLGWTAWGGDYMDEIWHGSDNYGYRTYGFTPVWNVQSLYDTPNYTWPVQELFNRLNSGFYMVHHLGHANVTYALKASLGQINNTNMTNNGMNHTYYLTYTQGCYCGAFEQGSITEKWTTIDNGAFAFISNSRYGWGSGNDTNGPSQRYHRQFVDAIFYENIFNLGDINRDSKHDNAPNINGSCMRWCYYEINLFGDPTIDIYSSTAEEFDVDCPVVCEIGEDGLVITVNGVENALVSVCRNGELLENALTDEAGVATVDLLIDQPGPLDVSITAHNHVPYFTQIIAIAPDEGYPNIQGVSVHDEVTGNGNGQADYGETVEIALEVVNRGLAAIQSLSVTAISLSPWLTIEPQPMGAENLDPNEGTTLTFPVQVSPITPDNTRAQIALSVIADDLNRNIDINVDLHAPRLTLRLIEINDENDGDGDYRLEPGEVGEVTFELTNDGTSDLNNVVLSLSATDPALQQIITNPEVIEVAADETIVIQNMVSITVAEEANDPCRAWLLCELTREDGYRYSVYKAIEIGGFFENLEREVEGWTHYSTAGWGDQWHVSDYRNWTHEGSHSWKLGGEGGANYADHLDAFLELPPIERTGPLTLSFRHWIDAEISRNYPGDCYDGGRVELSYDGEEWERIPMAGYNYSTRGTGPFGVDVMVYSGHIDWEEQSYTIYGQGMLYIRFHFGSDVGTTAEGWYIDDISLTMPDLLYYPSGFQGELEDGIVHLEWNTPMGELDEAAELLGFIVYRNSHAITNVIMETSYDDVLISEPSGIYEYEVSACYNRGISPPCDPIEIEWTQNIFNLTIPLRANYFEMISSYVVPEDLNAAQVFGNVNDLVIVYQSNGGIYLPPRINTIGALTMTQAYRILCESQSEVTFTGARLDPTTQYTLTRGPWQWFGYPFDVPVPIETALASVADQVDIVITDDGRMWLPHMHINTIGNMQPGEGYMTIVLETVTFQYVTERLLTATPPNNVAENSSLNSSVATGLPYAVLVQISPQILALDPSTIELWDNEQLVGNAVIQEEQEIIPVVAWEGSDEYHLAGFHDGAPITFVVKKADGSKIDIAQPEASACFGEGAYAQVNLDLVPTDLPADFRVEATYPNPFNPVFTVPFSLPEKGEVAIALFNILGQKVFSGRHLYEAGVHRYLFTTDQTRQPLVSGVYFLQVEFQGVSRIQKIVLLK